MVRHITIEDNRQEFDRLDLEVSKLANVTIFVGVIGKGDNQDFDLVDLATVHEFGVTISVTKKMRNWFLAQGYPLSSSKTKIRIPERSFIRRTADERKMKIVSVCNQALAAVVSGKYSAKMAVDKIGNYVVSLIQETIKKVSNPPLTQMTIELRESGGTSPLQDTGRLWQSIDYEVRW